MPRIFTSPENGLASDQKTVFLGGSIEMGKAELWQPRVGQRFVAEGFDVFDPRRKDWNSDWTQDPTPGTPFHQQVTWELDHLERADLVYFFLTGDGPAIVSMLEIGLMLAAHKNVVLHVAPSYMRRGNIVITAKRHNISVFDNESDAIASAVAILKGLNSSSYE